MSKIYYKVTDLNMCSRVMHTTDFCTKYKIGKFVSSPVPKTPLCVFETIYQALTFGYDRNSRIFKCKIKGKRRRAWIPNRHNIDNILKLIKNHKKIYSSGLIDTVLPYGTVSCTSVKLIEEVPHAYSQNI